MSALLAAFAFVAKHYRGRRPPTYVERGPDLFEVEDAWFALNPENAGGSYDALRGEDREERARLYHAVSAEAGRLSPLDERRAQEAADAAAREAARAPIRAEEARLFAERRARDEGFRAAAFERRSRIGAGIVGKTWSERIAALDDAKEAEDRGE